MRKTRVNKIMIGKNEDVHKETREILTEIFKKYEYDIVPKGFEESVQRFVLEVLGMPPIGDEPKIIKPNEQTTKQVTTTDDIDDNQKIADLGEVAQNPLVITVESEKEAKEVRNEKEDNTEKDEGKDEQVPMVRDTVESEKGKATNNQYISHPRAYQS